MAYNPQFSQNTIRGKNNAKRLRKFYWCGWKGLFLYLFGINLYVFRINISIFIYLFDLLLILNVFFFVYQFCVL